MGLCIFFIPLLIHLLCIYLLSTYYMLCHVYVGGQDRHGIYNLAGAVLLFVTLSGDNKLPQELSGSKQQVFV